MAETRRRWKKIFHRVRIYLPLVLLLLTGLVVFLPISSGWLSRYVERAIGDALGLDVRISQMEITIFSASADVFGLRVLGPNGEEEDPFEIAHVRARGGLRGLLAGGERWPDRVEVESPSALRVEKSATGEYRLAGGFRTLLAAIDPLLGGEDDISVREAAPGRVGRTPEVVLRNLQFEIEEPVEGLPPLSIRVDEMRVPERAAAGAPVRARLSGIAIADGTEEFELSLIYFPDQHRMSIQGELTGLVVPFFLPTLGDFAGRATSLALRFEGRLLEDDKLAGALTIDAGQFEIRQKRPGGERWTDDALEIRLRVEYDTKSARLVVQEMVLTGDEVNVAAGGDVILRDDFRGNVTAAVNRLPAAGLSLGRSELFQHLGVRVSELESSPSLRLEMAGSGPFAHPAQWDYDVSLHLGGWRVEATELPDAVRIHNLDLSVSPELVSLRDLRSEFGGLSLSASGEIPVSPAVVAATGTLRLEAGGTPGAAFDLFSRLDLVPDDLTSFEAPLEANASLVLSAFHNPEDGALGFGFHRTASRVTMSWGEGTADARQLAEAVRLAPGSLRYQGGVLRIYRLNFALDGLQASFSGEGSGGVLSGEDTPMVFEGRLTASGRLPKLLRHLEHHVDLAFIPRDIDGNFQGDLRVTVAEERWQAPDYRLRLLLDEASGTVATPHRPVPVSNLSAEIVLTPRDVEIRRMSLQIPDEETGVSTVQFAAFADAERARGEATARTRLEFLTSVLLTDLNDLYMEGVLPARGWGELRPVGGLPPGVDVPRRWISMLSRPNLRVRFDEEGDLQADFELNYQPETPLEITPREFPVRMENIRGNARFTPKGIEFWNARADIGSSRDVFVEYGLVELGIPVIVTVRGRTAYLDINEWMEGWGEQAWSSQPVARIPSWQRDPNPRMFLVVEGAILAEEVKLLQFTGGELSTDFRFESWSHAASPLRLENLRSENVYNGKAVGEIELLFDSDERPVLMASVGLDRVDLQPFMNDLLEREQAMDGRLSGNLEFEGQLLNYPSYRGVADYEIVESAFAREIIPVYARNIIEVTTGAERRDTVIRGTARMEDQRVHLPDLELFSSLTNLTADGYVDFDGNLVYDVTASVLSHHLRNLPVIGIMGDVVSFVGRNIVSYRLRGTVQEPSVQTIPTPARHLDVMGDLLREGRTILERPLRSPEQEEGAR